MRCFPTVAVQASEVGRAISTFRSLRAFCTCSRVYVLNAPLVPPDHLPDAQHFAIGESLTTVRAPPDSRDRAPLR